MRIDSPVDVAQQLGADRVLAPAGALPQPAERLDASGPVRPYELEVGVERLCLDSTSFRNIRERADADPRRMAERMLEDVAYLHRGVLAPSNAALVEMAVGLAGSLGREVATCEQASELELS